MRADVDVDIIIGIGTTGTIGMTGMTGMTDGTGMIPILIFHI